MAGRAESNGLEVFAWLPSRQADPSFGAGPPSPGLRRFLEQSGARHALWLYEPEAEAVVGALHRETGVAVHPVVPNMAAYVRDTADRGPIGAALVRFKRLGLADRVRLGLHHGRRAPGILGKDFTTGLLILIEMETAKVRPFGSRHVFLHPSVTDLALALGNRALFDAFLTFAGRTLGLTPALVTHNFGVLIPRLAEWGLRPPLIAAPFNPRGYLMYPSQARCEAALRSWPSPVLALRPDLDGRIPRPEAFAYLRSRGIRQAALDPGRGSSAEDDLR